MSKGLLPAVLIAAMLSVNTAFADEAKAVSSEWGNSGAKPAPVADSKGRAGFWWLPKDAASNKDDAEVWGNHGIVYGDWKKPVSKATEKENTSNKKQQNYRPYLDGPFLINNILFDFDKVALRPEAKAEIDKHVTWLKKKPKDTIILKGYTCSEGNADYNMKLGLRRAEAVKKYMVEFGIAPERIKTVSLGETKPFIPNDTNASRKLNRCVGFDIRLGD